MIDLLEKVGYRCNLYAGVSNCKDSGDRAYMLTKVKTDREPLNIKKICFTIANPSMLRRIDFKWLEVNDFEKDFTHSGYGHYDEKEKIKTILKDNLKENFIVLNYVNDQGSPEPEKILKILKEQGISLERSD